jgi:hypothetical protein
MTSQDALVGRVLREVANTLGRRDAFPTRAEIFRELHARAASLSPEREAGGERCGPDGQLAGGAILICQMSDGPCRHQCTRHECKLDHPAGVGATETAARLGGEKRNGETPGQASDESPVDVSVAASADRSPTSPLPAPVPEGDYPDDTERCNACGGDFATEGMVMSEDSGWFCADCVAALNAEKEPEPISAEQAAELLRQSAPPSPVTEAGKGELLPCPFCGPGESIVEPWYDDLSKCWRIGCGRCGVATGINPRDRSQSGASISWNRRPSPPSAGGREGLSERLRAEAKRVGTLFVVAVQTDDVEQREAAAFERDEIDFRNGPSFKLLTEAAEALDAARAENERLGELFKQRDEQLTGALTDYNKLGGEYESAEAQLRAMRSERDKAIEVSVDYASHRSTCKAWGTKTSDYVCSCGRDAALASLSPAKTEKEDGK